mmetsp:Transcript_59924/g.141783  ORF Transcript_59924/g.141783 Transcript_59924/m.141783 type:complete len:201 (+) Transcript_59924:1081-1683(+)
MVRTWYTRYPTKNTTQRMQPERAQYFSPDLSHSWCFTAAVSPQLRAKAGPWMMMYERAVSIMILPPTLAESLTLMPWVKNEKGAMFFFSLDLYLPLPSSLRSTRPAMIARPQGMVRSMMVDPARAPTPTSSWFWASGPSPEKSTIAPSGTAPRIGRTTLPTMPATSGNKRSNSEPSEIRLEPWNKTYPYATRRKRIWKNP